MIKKEKFTLANIENIFNYSDMSRLATNVTRLFVFCLSWRLDNVRRRRLGGIGRVLRKFSDLVSELSHLFGKLCVDFKQLGNLFFKFRDALNVE